MSKEVESFLEKIPGWEQASFERLPGGLSSGAWLLRRAGDCAVLSFDAETRPGFLLSRRQQSAVQQRAADIGVAPQVLFADTHCTLSQFVNGVHCSADMLRDESLATSLAHALAELHRLPAPDVAFPAKQAAEYYVARLPASLRAEAEVHVDTIMQSPSPQSLVCCHNDLVNDNVIIRADGSVCFVDFEFSAGNDPAFDLAVVIEESAPGNASRLALLRAYADAMSVASVDEWQLRVERQRRLYRSLCWLWRASRS